MAREPVSREEVLGALEHTLARGPARIEFCQEWGLDFDMAESESPPVRLGPHVRRFMRGPSRQSSESLLRAIGRFLRRWAGNLAASIILRLSKRWIGKVGALRAVGVFDFDAHRCMYGYSGQAEVMLVAGDKSWQGRSGAAVDPLSEKPASAIQPLWLLDLVRGFEEAHAGGEQRLDGHTCRRFVGHADLHRAADAVPYEMAMPAGMHQLGQLTRIPLELWVDAQRQIRRIRQDGGKRPDPRTGARPRGPTISSSLDLREFGVKAPADWSRLELPVAERMP